MLNKTDLVTKETVGLLRASIQKLNPKARFIETTHGKVQVGDIINTGLFNYEEAEESQGWIEELKKDEHTPESDEYGISSFVFRDQRVLFIQNGSLEYINTKFPSYGYSK